MKKKLLDKLLKSHKYKQNKGMSKKMSRKMNETLLSQTDNDEVKQR